MDVSTASYVAGFLDGDGSIHFQLVKQKEYRFGYYIRASISFSQSTPLGRVWSESRRCSEAVGTCEIEAPE